MLGSVKKATAVSPIPTSEDRQARQTRLVRNLLALRLVLAMDQMQTGKGRERIEEIDEELASLGHDMRSTAACAVEAMQRTVLLPRLIQQRNRASQRPAAP
jgi:hypothetical protein